VGLVGDDLQEAGRAGHSVELLLGVLAVREQLCAQIGIRPKIRPLA
jgi:hypothetical protein